MEWRPTLSNSYRQPMPQVEVVPELTAVVHDFTARKLQRLISFGIHKKAVVGELTLIENAHHIAEGG